MPENSSIPGPPVSRKTVGLPLPEQRMAIFRPVSSTTNSPSMSVLGEGSGLADGVRLAAAAADGAGVAASAGTDGAGESIAEVPG